MIRSLIERWKLAGVDRIVVVVAPDDPRLATCCAAAGVEVVRPAQAPPEMKDSVRLALDHLRATAAPGDGDVWLLAPADSPRLPPTVVRRLLAASRREPDAIFVPSYGGRRGHPVLFPWRLAAEIGQLEAGEGVNALLRRHPVRELACEAAEVLDDLDTPQDYQRLLRAEQRTDRPR